MPDFLPAELVQLRERVDALAAGPLRTLVDDAHQIGRAELARRVSAETKRAGVFGLTQAPEHGGLGGTPLQLVVAREALAAHNVVHLPGLFGPGPGPLGGVGEPLRSSHLLPLLAGERQGGFGFTEPAGARPTWARVEGDSFVVNGQKSYVTGGGDADFVNAVVDVEGRGPAVVVIDTALAGVELVRRFATLDGSHHAAFEFHDVRVPLTNIVGEAGSGMRRALGQIGDVRLAIASSATGLACWTVGYVHEHLQRPRRGGAAEPLAASERARLRYGELRMATFTARSVLYRAARLVEAGERAVNETMTAKFVATETVGTVVDAAVQLVGGEALVEGHPLESLLRRVRAWRLAEGESDQLRVNVARGALDLDAGRL